MSNQQLDNSVFTGFITDVKIPDTFVMPHDWSRPADYVPGRLGRPTVTCEVRSWDRRDQLDSLLMVPVRGRNQERLTHLIELACRTEDALTTGTSVVDLVRLWAEVLTRSDDYE